MVRIHVRPPAICSEIAILLLRPNPVLQSFCNPNAWLQMCRSESVGTGYPMKSKVIELCPIGHDHG